METRGGIVGGGEGKPADAARRNEARWLKPVQNVNQLPHAAVVAPVEVEGDAREVEPVLVFQFVGRGFDDFDFAADDDVGKIFVQRVEGGGCLLYTSRCV